MFTPPAAHVRKGIESEADRLGSFLNTKVAVEFVDEA
jgi:hypothetical protein